jgi:hypothetical protein
VARCRVRPPGRTGLLRDPRGEVTESRGTAQTLVETRPMRYL